MSQGYYCIKYCTRVLASTVMQQNEIKRYTDCKLKKILIILVYFTKISVNNLKASTKNLLGLESEFKQGLKI